MELYTLDQTFRKKDAIDVFDSLIWTERYSSAGDVTLILPSNSKYKGLVPEGSFLSIQGSQEVMLVDTVSDEDGKLTITGQTLVAFLAQRICRDSWSTDKNTWLLLGSPAVIAATIVEEMCSSGGLMSTIAILPGTNGEYEYIPYLHIGDLAAGADTIAAIPYGNVYDGVKSVCDIYNLGFTMYPEIMGTSDYNMTFTVYAGSYLTSDLSETPVIFESALGSFTNIKELRSISGYKTTAYAWANGLTDRGYIGVAHVPGTELFVGFERRTMMVDATDVNAADYTPTEIVDILNQKAKDALANNNYVRMTDGLIVPQNAFKYGTHYKLGDVVELRGAGNVAQKARITEYIRSQDSAGESSYPTLSIVD